MTGALQSAFQNFKSSVKIINIDLLVVGAGGGGAGGTYFDSGGYGGDAGRGATVYDTSNRVIVNSSYTVTVAAATNYGEQVWNGSSWVTTAGGNGGASSISGIFGINAGLNAPGGLGTSSAGGAGSGVGLNTYSITPNVYSAIAGGNYYGGGASGGTYRTYLGGAGAGTSGSSYGSAGGGGNGGSTSFGASGVGARGGGGAAGIVIMRCRQDAYTSYTASGATVTTITIDSIVYSLFTWTTSGSITFT